MIRCSRTWSFSLYSFYRKDNLVTQVNKINHEWYRHVLISQNEWLLPRNLLVSGTRTVLLPTVHYTWTNIPICRQTESWKNSKCVERLKALISENPDKVIEQKTTDESGKGSKDTVLFYLRYRTVTFASFTQSQFPFLVDKLVHYVFCRYRTLSPCKDLTIIGEW
jgi:hypothetical protein